MISTIEWVVADFHPMTSDEEVAEHIRRRIEDARERGRDIEDAREWALIEAAVSFHQRNRKAYIASIDSPASYSLSD